MSGKVVHFEIPFDDGERARDFYQKVFGWELMELPEMSYTMVSTGPGGFEAGPTEPGFINWQLPAGYTPSLPPTDLAEADIAPIICKRDPKVGSTIIKIRQCLTAREWTVQERQWREELDRIMKPGQLRAN